MSRHLALPALLLLLVVSNLELFARGRLQADTVGFRAGEPAPDPGYARTAPPNLVHVFYDGTRDVSTNAEGIRNPAVPFPPAPHEIRILCFGDSGTFGTGLAEAQTWPRRLEPMLQQAQPASVCVRVINAGQSGYNVYRAVALMARLGKRYRPDLVIAMFGFTDMQSCAIHGFLAAPAAGGPTGWWRRSAGLLYLARRWTPPWDPVFDADGWGRFPRSITWWDASAANMRYLAALTAAQGGHLLAIAQPLRVRRDAYSIDAPMPVDYRRLQQAYVHMGRRHGIPVMVMDDVFHRSGLDESALFLPQQSPTHMTARGDAIVARAVADRLTAQGWLRTPREAAR